MTNLLGSCLTLLGQCESITPKGTLPNYFSKISIILTLSLGPPPPPYQAQILV